MRTGSTDTSIKIIASKAGDKAIVVGTTGQILDIDKGIAGSIAATRSRTIGVIEINRHAFIGGSVVHAVMRACRTDATIKIITGKIGDKGIVKATTGQILNINQRIAGGITTAGTAAVCIVQVDDDAGIGGGIADTIV